MMEIRQAYNQWAGQYDTNDNKTRDLEAQVLRCMLNGIPFQSCLEIGCGTGKNTEWLVTKAKELMCVDLSEEMLAVAMKKIKSPFVRFAQADINQPWDFRKKTYDLVSFSLVLEHIESLGHVFRESATALHKGGFLYLGELHPFKQYAGSKARFETAGGTQVVTCFDHHLSDFLHAGKQSGLRLMEVEEFFDEGDRRGIPRILAVLFKKM